MALNVGADLAGAVAICSFTYISDSPCCSSKLAKVCRRTWTMLRRRRRTFAFDTTAVVAPPQGLASVRGAG